MPPAQQAKGKSRKAASGGSRLRGGRAAGLPGHPAEGSRWVASRPSRARAVLRSLDAAATVGRAWASWEARGGVSVGRVWGRWRVLYWKALCAALGASQNGVPSRNPRFFRQAGKASIGAGRRIPHKVIDLDALVAGLELG